MTPAELAELKAKMLKTYGPCRDIREGIEKLFAYVEELEGAENDEAGNKEQ